MRSINRSRSSGFSLIEVLIAVAVLSFGLLALASLQVSLVRASAESKAQSIALELAKSKIESLRTFQTLDNYRTNIVNGSDTASYSGSDIAFTRTWTVTHYGNAGAGFVILGNAAAVPSGNNDFKQIQVTVSWYDSTSATTPHSVTLDDAIGALDPSDSARLSKLQTSVTPRKAKAVIFDPSSAAGDGSVIPVALGNGSQTAATNPTPNVAGRATSSAHIIETRFDVLTYAAINSTTATEQSRVETALVGCQCNMTTTTATGFRPTYWDGTRYVVPSQASYTAPATAATGLSVSQSPKCTICCRDHHDPSGVTGAKFSPRRASHTHYALDAVTETTAGDSGSAISSSNPFTITSLIPAPVTTVSLVGGASAVTSGPYMEACRVIRVDGIYRVAADEFNDHTDLLQTNPDAASNVQALYTLPAATAAASPTSAYRYASSSGFVLTYMSNRFVNTTAGAATTQATYNTASAGGDPTLPLHPASIPMGKADTISRYLHLRGLYVDYLEPEAVAAINAAKTACTASNAITSGSCTLSSVILPLLPFTSINITELANWVNYRQPTKTTGSSTTIQAGDVNKYYPDAVYDHSFSANNDFLTSLTVTPPVRGATDPGYNIPASIAVTPVVSGEIYSGNAGLALLQDPVNADATIKRDVQSFSMTTGNPLANSGNFSVTIPVVTSSNTNAYTFSLSTGAYPTFASNPTSKCNYATKNSGGTKKPNPYTCVSRSLGLGTPMVLSISKYNYTNATTSSGTLSCGYTGSYTVNVCKKYTVSSVTASPSRTITVGTPSFPGSVSESTPITINGPVTGDAYTINLVPGTSTTMPTTCTATGSGAATVYTITPTPCP